MKVSWKPLTIIAFVFTTLALGSCFSPWKGDEANLIINLGGGGRAAFSDAEIDSFSHTVTISGGPGQAQEVTGVKYGSAVSFTVLPGRWDIRVQAFGADGILKAEGAKTVDVSAGVNPPVQIVMETAGGVLPGTAGLYQKSGTPVQYTNTNVSYGDIKAVIAHISNNQGDYLLLIDGTTTISTLPEELTSNSLTIQGLNDENPAVLRLDDGATGSLFIVNNSASLTLEKNVTLRGHSANTSDLVSVYDGSFTMNEGSRITGNTSRGSGGGAVYVNGPASVFTMNGGEISGNTANNGGGVYVQSEGAFVMTGGTIYGNTATRSTDGTGGTGGGVFIDAEFNAAFTKTGGTIYGADETGADENGSPLKNTAGAGDGSGHAVYVAVDNSGRNDKYQDNTSGESHYLKSATYDNWDSTANTTFVIQLNFHEDDLLLNPGGDLTFLLDDEWAAYKWLLDGVDVTDPANPSKYHFAEPEEAGNYEVAVIVTDENGQQYSGSCRVRVR